MGQGIALALSYCLLGQMEPVTLNELQTALPYVMGAPKDKAPVLGLCLRPGYGKRRPVTEVHFTREFGIQGERWATAPWMKLSDGSPDPRIQVSILGVRVMDLVWRNRNNTPHPGDPVVTDMDLSEENVPTGSILQIGSARIRVSDVFNDACVKWKVRYGEDAKAWISRPQNRPLRLRGILCEVVTDGIVRTGDLIQKI